MPKRKPRPQLPEDGRGFLGQLRGAETPLTLPKLTPAAALAQKKAPPVKWDKTDGAWSPRTETEDDARQKIGGRIE
jgi:hypothetical protein